MAFESLTEKLQNVFKGLRKKGKLTEDDVKAAMKEVKMALLEADVNFKVVKSFISTVTERAVGSDVVNSLTPAQMVIKIVNEELISLMGSEEKSIKFLPSNEITTIMMAGLQGAGKTTAASKLAGQLKNKGKKPLLVACDVYRPAAIEQLQVNAKKVGVPVFEMGTNVKPIKIVEEALDFAKKNGNNPVIIDTAGRLQVDEDMMNELISITEKFTMTNILLTVDAMAGQDAV
ncbi:MAG: signal recognition particle receptor subunit alpha, partial [Lachnospiraceae bacterium]|nr:signal recognition particle receptor subunit alpha [Lachnospiraceae bacterium]